MLWHVMYDNGKEGHLGCTEMGAALSAVQAEPADANSKVLEVEHSPENWARWLEQLSVFIGAHGGRHPRKASAQPRELGKQAKMSTPWNERIVSVCRAGAATRGGARVGVGQAHARGCSQRPRRAHTAEETKSHCCTDYNPSSFNPSAEEATAR